MQETFIYFSPYLPPENLAAAVRGSYFIRKLKEHGFSFQVITTSPTQSSDVQQTLIRFASNRSSFAVRFLFELLVGIELSLRIAAAKLQNPNLKHVLLSSPPYVTTLLTSFACRLMGLNYWLDIRDPYPEVYFQHQLIAEDSFMGRLQKRLARSLYQNCEQVFAATEGFKKMILRHLPPEQVTGSQQAATYHHAPNDKVIVARNGFDEELFKPSTEKFDTFTCVFHGNLGHMQNISLLCEVAKRVGGVQPHIQFLVMGSGPNENMIREAQLKNIKYLGETPYLEIAQKVAKSHLGLSFRQDGPLGETSLPVRVFEYLGCGLPCIITPVSEAGQIVQSEQLGFQFKNADIDKIVEQILKLATDQNTYNELVNRVIDKRMLYSRAHASQLLVKKIQMKF